jgi:hypothetical protein
VNRLVLLGLLGYDILAEHSLPLAPRAPSFLREVALEVQVSPEVSIAWFEQSIVLDLARVLEPFIRNAAIPGPLWPSSPRITLSVSYSLRKK